MAIKSENPHAGKGEGIRHPIISVLERHAPALARMTTEHRAFSKEDSLNSVDCRKRFGFLADEFVALGSFELSPNDLLAIWTHANEVLPFLYQRYALAATLTTAYAVQEMKNRDWEKLPRAYLESREFPEEIKQDKIGLRLFDGRLDEIRNVINALECTESGTDQSNMSRGIALSRKARDGDKEAERELDALVAATEKGNPVIADIGENFSNTLLPISWKVNDLLDAKP